MMEKTTSDITDSMRGKNQHNTKQEDVLEELSPDEYQTFWSETYNNQIAVKNKYFNPENNEEISEIYKIEPDNSINKQYEKGIKITDENICQNIQSEINYNKRAIPLPENNAMKEDDHLIDEQEATATYWLNLRDE
ncbi:MAG: hypothetical protein ACQESC_04925 [Nanobdellota archaeon]